jgi:hypothetical protein
MNDLEALKEKMDLCQSMLNPGAGTPKLSVHSDDAMLAVIGFLEACAPRMIELVEAASMSGVLSETVFEEVLQCNDRLQKTLADVETAALTETTADTTAASAPPAAGTDDSTDLMDQFGDLLLDEPAMPAAAPAGAKTTGETGDDGDVKQPATIQASSSNDEFDAFFAERQGS